LIWFASLFLDECLVLFGNDTIGRIAVDSRLDLAPSETGHAPPDGVG
jgi:hypothetical protein